MLCEVKIGRAFGIGIWQHLCASVLQPKSVPLVFKALQVGQRTRRFSHVAHALSDGISGNSREYLIEGRQVLAHASATSIDNDECIAGQFIEVPIPLKAMSASGTLDSRLLLSYFLHDVRLH